MKTLLLSAVVACAATLSGGTLAPKALVIMLDGMRADTIDNGLAPNIKSLADGKWQPGYRGAWTLCANTLRDGTTESAPNHVAIATGMTVKKTGIDDNGDLVRRGTTTDKMPTWLARLKLPTTIYRLPTTNSLKPLHIFAWYADLRLSPDYGVQFIFDRDKANAKTLTKMMCDADAPDAIMWYIDLPDHAGHGHGYYPYSKQYKDAVRESDRYVGDVLAAIAARPTFAQEDWLVIVTADHGGWERSHGQMSTQCYTVPLVVAGRRVPQGRIPGVPHNYDAAPTALAHFGVDVSKIDFDGKVRGNGGALGDRALPDAGGAPRTLTDGLAVYLPFSEGETVNRGSSDVVAELRGKAAPIVDGAIGGGLRVSASTNSAGGVCLKGSERLKFENGADFGFAVWVRTFGPQIGDPVVFGNKNWSGGSNPGVLLTASRGVDMSRVCPAHYDVKKRGKSPGFMFNCGRAGKHREDLGVYNPDFGQWTFYAATRGTDGVVRFYQGRRDGQLYCVADDLSDIAFDTGMPFGIGQDGRGVAEYTFVGDVDEFAIWTRTLAHDEVRRIFEAELVGKGLPTAGFYRLERLADDGWRVLDPQGGTFVPLGVEHCRLWGEGDFEKRMLARFATKESWEKDALAKLKDWNFTLLGGCCAPALFHRGIPHTIYPWLGEPYSFDGGDKAILKGSHRPGTAFPNVFNPGWAEYCREWTRKHFAPQRNDRDLFGWFFDNELAWWGDRVSDAPKQGTYRLVDVVAALPPEHSARRAYDAFMAEHRGEWTATKCRAEFLRLIAERYFGGIVSALREADPNHLILGCRFSGVWMEPEILEVAGKWLDVISFNHYSWVDTASGAVRISYREGASSQPVEQRYREMYALAKKPFFVTEWSFPAMDAGLPCTVGEGMRTETQKERTKASETFARKLMSLPFVIGYNYFMWHDSTAGGENCNYGLVNNDGGAYAELTSMFRRVNSEFVHERTGRK